MTRGSSPGLLLVALAIVLLAARRARRVFLLAALALIASPGAAQRTVGAGRSHTCFTDGGGVMCFGAGDSGQLGPAPPTIPIDDVVEVDAGLLHTCARRAGGDVWCWGGNAHGQAGAADGREPFGAAPAPTRIALDGATQLSVGAMHACAVTRDRRAMCWGGSTFGELGPDAGGGPAPVALPVRDVARVYAGAGVTCVDDTRGERACFGRAATLAEQGTGPVAVSARATCAVDRGGTLRCDDATLAERLASADVGTIHDVAVSGRDVCVAGARGAACAGVPWSIVPRSAAPSAASDVIGTLDEQTTTPAPVLVRVADGPVTHVELGAYVGCVVAAGERRCWGLDAERIAGLGLTLDRIEIGDRVDALQGSPGLHLCVQTARGEVWCGPGPGAMRRVEGLPRATAIAASETLGCALADGEAWCWAHGRAAERVELPGPASLIATGGGHACVVVDLGVWCWGRNELGQADPDDTSLVLARPARVSRVTRESGARALRLEASRSCAELAAGGSVCWGGAPGASERDEPCAIEGGLARCGSFLLPMSEPRALAPGRHEVCVLGARGEAGCARTPSSWSGAVWPPRAVPLDLWRSR